MNLRLFLPAAGLCAVLLSSPACAAFQDSDGQLTDTSWPDLLEISSDLKIKEREEERPSLFVSLKGHPYTDEELDEIFGDFPCYLESGSFFLNRLNHLPSGRIATEGGRVFINGKPYSFRIPWTDLEKEITGRLEDFQGDWSVYVKDLSTGKTMEINEHTMESASLIKLYIAGTIYEKIESNELTPDERLYTALNDMIVYSDNESSNVLVRYLYDADAGETFQDGLDVVNDFITRHGFSKTVQVNGIADPSLWVSDGRVNLTSAADCGHLLEMVYNGELVSHYASFRFETLLNRQEVNYKIPAALPEGTHISHKTGEVDDTENDAAIVYTPYGDYIFCIMSTDLTNTQDAVDHIHEITRLVHDYFTTPPLSAEDNNPPAAGINAKGDDSNVSFMGKTLEE